MPDSSQSDVSTGDHGGAAEEVKPAGTAAGIWKQIDDEHAALRNAIAAGSLGEVHRHAFAIRDLVAALPSVTTDPASRSKIEAAKATVASEAADLDKAGDAGDLTATQAALARLDATLRELRP